MHTDSIPEKQINLLPVVLLHGQPGSPSDWAAVSEHLGRQGEVLIPIRPGYGDADPPGVGAGGGGFRANADAVVALLDAAGIERAVVVGHSWAGGVVLALGLHYPNRVAGAVLVSSVGPGAVDIVDRLLDLPVVGRVLASVIVTVSGIATGNRYRGSKRRQITTTFLMEQAALYNELGELGKRLGEIDIPTVVLNGTRDFVTPVRIARALVEQLPNAELQLVPRRGHLLAYRAPAQVAAAIDQLRLRESQ